MGNPDLVEYVHFSSEGVFQSLVVVCLLVGGGGGGGSMEVGEGWRESSYSCLPFCSNRVSNQEPLNKESSTAECCPYYISHPLHCLKQTNHWQDIRCDVTCYTSHPLHCLK